MTTATNLPNLSFLVECRQDLEPSKITSYDRQSTLWSVAGVVTLVAFGALCVSAFFYAGLFFPVYAPFIALGSLLLAAPVGNFARTLFDYSAASKSEATKYREIGRHYADLSQKTNGQIEGEFTARGIQIPGISQGVISLTPLLARANYLNDKIQEHLLLKQNLTSEARELATANFAANRQKIYTLRNAALSAEEKAMQNKIEAAFTHAVLRKGDFQGSLNSIALPTGTSYPERLVGNALREQTGTNIFLTFKNSLLPPLTDTDVRGMSVAQLGSKFVAAMG